ncbi:hypothetical protein P2H44_09150 [Albimonas sp. CAU 1670]|uniref:calcium-binding protein n=1 Tax=Albimonas sp. CAU 1670 TaxID=3032599 RepID=UPI0023DAEB81|nr:hypothetical protein [Albimonas sp. CAU 1670]MDF2232717.1 hypothetical protein [Albimonas sp. CAU 1670]
MAFINQLSSSTQRVLAPNDELYVGAGVKLVVTLDAVTGGEGAVVRVDGTVVSLSDDAIDLAAPNGSNVSTVVSVGANGIVSGSGGAYADFGLRLSSGRQLVSNAGDISGGTGVYATNGTGMTLQNSGAIRGLDRSAAGVDVRTNGFLDVGNSGVIEGPSFGVYSQGSTFLANNTGVIRTQSLGSATGMDASGGAGRVTSVYNGGEIHGAVGLELSIFETGALVNAGRIVGAAQEGACLDRIDAASVDNSGLIVGAIGLALDEVGVATVRNGGEIAGLSGAGIDAEPDLIASRLDLRNTGEISGLGAAVRAGYLDDRVWSSGAILGDVALGDGLNRVRSTGEIDGDVIVGRGSDRVANAGEVSGDVDTGATADSVINRGVIGGDVSLGQGNDTYKGRKGGEVDGRVQGGDDNDTLLGSSEDDVFEGGGGFDTLRGRGGDDLLRGGAGEDLIAGGAGDDEMAGGINADVFRIGRHSGDDRIADWTDGEDVLNLRALNIEITTSVGDVKAASQNRAGGVVIIDLDALGGDGSLEIAGWNVNLMSSDDFIF